MVAVCKEGDLPLDLLEVFLVLLCEGDDFDGDTGAIRPVQSLVDCSVCTLACEDREDRDEEWKVAVQAREEASWGGDWGPTDVSWLAIIDAVTKLECEGQGSAARWL